MRYCYVVFVLIVLFVFFFFNGSADTGVYTGVVGGRRRMCIETGVDVSKIRGGGIGDLYCRVTVETPVKLSKRQKELLQEFAGESDAKQSPKQTGWFYNVKRFVDTLTD